MPNAAHIVQVFLPVVALMFTPLAHGQGAAAYPYTIHVEGNIWSEMNGEPMKESYVVVKRKDQEDLHVKANRKGHYLVELKGGERVELVYEAPGQVPKRVEIDTRGAPALLDVPSLTIGVGISLFPPLAGSGDEIFEQPLGKARYKHSVRNIVWDVQYGREMRANLRRFMIQYDNETRKEEQLAKQWAGGRHVALDPK